MAKKNAPLSPTTKNYNALQAAYDYFNERLFGGKLPNCLVTMQDSRKFAGFFAPDRFKSIVGREVVHEICMNPTLFAKRDQRDVLSTLVHEQLHLWQAVFGKPSRNGYHNKEWGAEMEKVGLVPSSTGAPGGKKTGQKMSHYIVEGGRFDVEARKLLADGGYFPYGTAWTTADEEKAKKKAKQRASKSKFVCEECDQACWGKPTLAVKCAECDVLMTIEIGESE